jgi:hypothetical protein
MAFVWFYDGRPSTVSSANLCNTHKHFYDSCYVQNIVYKGFRTYLGELMETVTETEIFAPEFKEITIAIMNIKLQKSCYMSGFICDIYLPLQLKFVC